MAVKQIGDVFAHKRVNTYCYKSRFKILGFFYSQNTNFVGNHRINHSCDPQPHAGGEERQPIHQPDRQAATEMQIRELLTSERECGSCSRRLPLARL
jgi:hypothetical protein